MLRASALGNANAKCEENLAFQAPKCFASWNTKPKYCKKKNNIFLSL